MARAWHHLPMAALAVLWNLLLAGHYLGMRLGVELFTANFTADQVAFFMVQPMWLDGAWAVAVWLGLLGALMLANRSATGVFFALSCAGWLATAVGWFLLRDPSAMTLFGQTGLTLIVIAIGAAFVFAVYARWMHVRWRYAR